MRKKIIQRLVISTLGERDYSAQEVIHILMGWPMYRASRTFTCLRVFDNDLQPLSRIHDNERFTIGKNIIDRYRCRPTQISSQSGVLYLENMTLLEFSKQCFAKLEKDDTGNYYNYLQGLRPCKNARFAGGR